jgi:Xaa-Pro dipeptidase
LTGASAFWANEFDVEEAPEPETVMAQAIAAAGSGAKTSAFVGEDAALASANGLAVNPPSLVSWLDWDRARKTAYEVHCLEEATAASARGHAAAREAFLAGASELSIHHAYVRATGCADDALPYPTIVCLDEKAAVLHYHAKRPSGSGRNLLIDAGATTRGYGCDITRTTTRDDADPLFRALVSGVNALQQRLCAMVKPGASYIDIHLTAHREVAVLLKETALLKASVDEAVERRYTTPFFPHGVGHHLGIQVHDIGGHQTGPAGGTTPPPAGHPFLRNTRPIEADHVFTIEPGLYFIHMLLKPLRAEAGAAFDWTAIDALAPYGGVRVEDNLVVTASGHRNLTREQLPN